MPPKSNRKRVSGTRSNPGTRTAAHPPPFTPSITVSKHQRFQASAAGTYTIKAVDLGDLICMAATATSAYQLARTVKLQKITVWGPPSDTLVPVTTSLEWSGITAAVQGNSLTLSDTSIGATTPSCVSGSPPRTARASQWQLSTDVGVLCTITVPLNAIIDVHYKFVVEEKAGLTSVTGAVAGASVGQVYCRALTSSTSTTALPPLSYITI